MKPQIVVTDLAPTAVGPYSQAIEVDGWLFLSGQIPIDPKTGKLVEGDIAAQTGQVMRNIEAVLRAAGASFDDVCKATIFTVNLLDFPAINQAYQSFIGSHRPARSTIQVAALPLGAEIEIEVVARKQGAECIDALESMPKKLK